MAALTAKSVTKTVPGVYFFSYECIFNRFWAPRRDPKMLEKGRGTSAKTMFGPNMLGFLRPCEHVLQCSLYFYHFTSNLDRLGTYFPSNLVAISHRRGRFRTAILDILVFPILKDRQATSLRPPLGPAECAERLNPPPFAEGLRGVLNALHNPACTLRRESYEV